MLGSSWECLDALNAVSGTTINKKTKPIEHWVQDPGVWRTASVWGVCKFGVFKSKKKEDMPVCKDKPLQCAPGPKVNWGACVAQDVSNWECIRQDEGEIDRYVKGDCLATPVKNSNGQELYTSVCRFATKEDAEYHKPEKCPPEASTNAPEGSTSACFMFETSLWGSYRQPYEESIPCEWTLNARKAGTFYDGECLLPLPALPLPALQENAGIGAGWIVLLIGVGLIAGIGVGFLFGRASKTGPRALSGGLMR